MKPRRSRFSSLTGSVRRFTSTLSLPAGFFSEEKTPMDATGSLRKVLKKDQAIVRYEFEDDSDSGNENGDEEGVITQEPEELEDDEDDESDSVKVKDYGWSASDHSNDPESPSTTPPSSTKALTAPVPVGPAPHISFEAIEPKGIVRPVQTKKAKKRMASFSDAGLDWKLKEVEDKSMLNVKTVCATCGKKGVNFPSAKDGRTFCSRHCRVAARADTARLVS
ncbi:hypothetical protein BT69DRAFT_1280165 [Atractiella rhizophila]|nr:hypothetical protein BT69DRAFT_1280165 [Atractiella rhizophila]